MLTGTTLELRVGFAHAADDELAATLEGAREDFHVRFRKVYDPAAGVHSHPIFYSGHADAAYLLIQGQWTFKSLDGVGGFRMQRVRASRRAARIRERALAIAGAGRPFDS